MGKRILGLDLGTNSIGWGVVDDLGNGEFELVKRGVHIFQEGVKIEKGNESSKAAERTGYRSARRLKFRRKLRKIETLKVLSEAGFCPPLSEEELKNWQSKKIYPKNSTFRDWCRTSDPKDKENGVFDNPYYFRWLAATQTMNLDDEAERFKLGRAFYHMAQRRGFKSNRLDSTPEREDGVVKKDISELSAKMDGRTLGQYFWEECYQKGTKIRKVHTSRNEHYLAEFEFVCEKQGVSDELKEKLHRAMFYQRPLKSQKGLVAKCPFEPKKKRAPVSHPLFEEFRMWQTLNNIKIKTLDDAALRPLTEDEKALISPLFFRVRDSKPRFDFKDIAKAILKSLNPKKQKHAYVKSRDASSAHVLFNYRDDHSISGCPLTAGLMRLFGDDYRQNLFDAYCGNKQDKDGNSKSIEDVLHEVWHVLFSFDDAEKVKEYAKAKLGLDEEGAERFSKIKVPQGYGALSLKAIHKILPYLKQGLLYSHAVFFANLDQVIGISADENENLKSDISKLIDEHNQYLAETRCVNEFVREYKDSPQAFEEKYDLRNMQDFERKLPEELRGSSSSICRRVRFLISENNGNGEYAPVKRLDERVGEYLMDEFNVSPDALETLYHPSAIETYKPAEKHSDGKYYLGDPRISSIKNPVFMRAMHRVKAVVNELLKQGIITDQTQVHVEMARELNDANKRAAIKTWQRINEKKRTGFKKLIEEVLQGQGINREATDDEILRYQLWEEQKHLCLYTGVEISSSDFIGENPRFDIEHTIPRSQSCDNSQENRTLCDRNYNRNVKRNQIPFDCSDYEEILQRIEPWRDRVDELNKLIEKQRPKSKYAATKEAKDNAIQKRLVWEFERNYLRGKIRRFTMEEVTSGFKNSQLIDTRIITKYARLYLQTVFSKVHTVNGKATDDFRRCWGVEKCRDNHAHHTVDAIVVACATRDQYDQLARYYHEYESYGLNDPSIPSKPHFSKPWETFTEDMKNLKNEILVSYYAPNHLLKQTKRKARKNGRVIPLIVDDVVQKDEKGRVIPRYYVQGKTARGSLHLDTFYGKINDHGDLKYVVRVPLVYKPKGGVFGFDSKEYKDGDLALFEKRHSDSTKGKEKAKKQFKERRAWNTRDLERIVDRDVRDLIIKEIRSRMKTGLSFNEAISEPIWRNKKKGIVVKRVRCETKPKGVIELKDHQDVSDQQSSEWKKSYYVENDTNYLIALYEGFAGTGRVKHTFISFNNYAAASRGENAMSLPASVDVKGAECRLKHILRVGDYVLFYEDVPEEVHTLTSEELSSRLYEVYGFRGDDGRVNFRFHLEAREDKAQGRPLSSFDAGNPSPKLELSSSKMKFLVGGVDFNLNVLGEIEFLKE